MSALLDIMNKLIAEKKASLNKSFFIIAESIEDEKEKIDKIQRQNNGIITNITVFKLYAE